MELIDTHAHLYLPEFEADLNQVVDKAKSEGVNYILLPAIDSNTHEKMLALEDRFDKCSSMIGLHPCSVNQEYKKELAHIDHWLERRKFIAIGEIGLDFYWDKTHAYEQYEAFHQQIETALRLDLPIAIHSRNATEECIEVVKHYPGLRGVFHCFSGTAEQAEKILELNFYLGIGGVVTFKNSGLDKIIESIGLRNVVLETDAPYLAPVPFRGKRNESSYLKMIAEKIAQLTDHTVQEVANVTTKHAKNLFRLG